MQIIENNWLERKRLNLEKEIEKEKLKIEQERLKKLYLQGWEAN